MIINGQSFSERELEYLELLDNDGQNSTVKNTMGTRYPLNPFTVVERFIDVLISAFNNAKQPK